MKKLNIPLMIATLMVTSQAISQNETKINPIKINTFGVEYGYNSYLLTSDLESMTKYFLDLSQIKGFEGESSERMYINTVNYYSINSGFKLRNKKSNTFREKLEMSINVSGSKFYHSYLFYNAQTDTVGVNTITTTNEIGDTLLTQKGYTLQVEEKLDDYTYSANRVSIQNEWIYHFNPNNRLQVSASFGGSLGFLYKANIFWRKKHGVDTYLVEQYESRYNEEPIQKEVFYNEFLDTQGNHAFSMAAFSKIHFDYQLSKTNTFWSKMSLNLNFFYKLVFDKYQGYHFDTPIHYYGGGIGLKYYL